MKSELLPDELCWAQGGHASDVALTALADGQLAIVPEPVRTHVDGCHACTQHLGNAALLSMHTAREIETLKQVDARAASPMRRPLPRLAIALGLAVAMLGLVPSLLDPPRFLSASEAKALFSGAGTLGRGVLDSSGTLSLAITYGVATLLFGFGFVLVRFLAKKETQS